jgi:hypothetical protein
MAQGKNGPLNGCLASVGVDADNGGKPVGEDWCWIYRSHRRQHQRRCATVGYSAGEWCILRCRMHRTPSVVIAIRR